MVLGVANKTKNEYTEMKNRFVLNAPVDLFKLINTAFNYYYQAPKEIVMRGCLSLCFKLVQNFQKEFCTLVTNEADQELDAVIAMSNSNIDFIDQTKKFTGTIHTISKVPKETVELFFNQGTLIKEWAKTSNVAFTRFQQLMANEIADSFLSIPNYKKFEIEPFCDRWFSYLMEKLTRLNKSYAKKCWGQIYQEFTTYYIAMVIKNSSEYKPGDLVKIQEKVEMEVDFITNVFNEKVPEKEYLENKTKIDALKQCFSAPHDKLMIHIGILRLKLSDQFDEHALNQILKLRSDIDETIKMAFHEILQEKSAQLTAKDTQASGKMASKSIMLEFRIMQFVTKLRKKIAKRKEFLKKREENGRDANFQKIDPKEKFEIEEMALHKRGEIDISFNDVPKDCADTKKFWDEKRTTGGFFNFEKRYFFFLDDTFCWKQNLSAKTNDGRFFLSGIEDLNIFEDKPEGAEVAESYYLWLRVGLIIYTFHFFDDEALKDWSKAIVYLRDEAMLATKPVEFRKFSAVPDEERMDELFNCDKPNYNYDQIKIKVAADRRRRELGLKGMGEEMEKTKERSDEELSNSVDKSSEEEEEPTDFKGKMKHKMKKKHKVFEKKMMADPKKAKFYTGFKKFLGF